MDLMGTLLKSVWDPEHILVFVDYTTQYPETVPLRKAISCIIVQDLMFTWLGTPRAQTSLFCGTPTSASPSSFTLMRQRQPWEQSCLKYLKGRSTRSCIKVQLSTNMLLLYGKPLTEPTSPPQNTFFSLACFLTLLPTTGPDSELNGNTPLF